MGKKAGFVLVAFLFVFTQGSARADVTPALTEMSLEDLMNVQITSVSKTPQVLSKTPAAVYVINNDEIHRSGATTVPDLLRSVPGVQVGRIDASTWGVSIRGFNDRFANKLLVLMDGRSVYTPLFSGTFWNIQDTEFEDIERIEVIRGPGGTVWGANAVNGIINIITKSAKDTQGVYTAGGYGTKEIGFNDVRVGSKVGDNFYYRFYNKYYNRERSFGGEDDWEAGKFGGRSDWYMDSDNHLTVQGDFYKGYGYTGQTVRRFLNPPASFGAPGYTGPYDRIDNVNIFSHGGNLLGRYTHNFSKDSDLSIQTYYDTTYLDDPFIAEARDTYDIDARYRFPVEFGVPQEIIVGGGYRYTSDRTRGSFEVNFDPANKATDIITWSVQDEMRLVENFLTAWVGSKFEHNQYTGYEAQPTARIAIYPDSKNTIWASVTRAVRTPSRADRDVQIRETQGTTATGLGVTPVIVNISGNKHFKSETVVAYEAGLKSQVTDKINLDFTSFYNEYDRLRVGIFQPTTTAAFPSLITTLPDSLQNEMRGQTYGVEASVKYFATDHVRFNGTYSYLKMKLQANSNLNVDPTAELAESESPNHQVSGGVSLDLPWNLYFDTELRYVGALEALHIGDYLVTDMRLAWKPKSDLELSVVGLNLFDAYHYEFITPGGLDFLGMSTRAQPSVYGKLEAKF